MCRSFIHRWLFILLCFAAFSAGAGQAGAFERAPQGEALVFGRSVVTIESKTGRHVFDVELADTMPLRQRGLMFREHLKANQGMLFVFDQPNVVNMWMKNTPLSLDMIFIATNGRVLRVAHNTTPYSENVISSGAMALGVLEIRGGRADELGIKAGDWLRHDAFGR